MVRGSKPVPCFSSEADNKFFHRASIFAERSATTMEAALHRQDVRHRRRRDGQVGQGQGQEQGQEQGQWLGGVSGRKFEFVAIQNHNDSIKEGPIFV